MMYLGPLQLFRKKPKLIHTTHGLDHIKNYPRAKLYESIVMRWCQHLIGVSDKIGNFYKHELKLNQKKITVIPNGIATYEGKITTPLRNEKKKWLCERHNLNPDKPMILSLSRIVRLKDQKFLVECFNQRPEYQLIIAGPPSDPDYNKEIKSMAKNNITFVGSQELVLDYNLGVDLYVSASTTEGIPVAVLEAMAVATPVLISDIPGHTTLNQYQDVVNTYQIGKQEDFLFHCDNIINNKNNFDSIAMNSKTVVEKYFSVKAMVEAYMKVYKNA